MEGMIGVIVTMVLFVLAIVWIALPFAVFGIKDRIDKAIRNQVSIDRRLANIEQHNKAVLEQAEYQSQLMHERSKREA